MVLNKDGPVVTDNGQLIIDAKFGLDVDLREVDARLHRTPGVLDTGLFFDLAAKVLVGVSDDMSVRTLERKA
jgi:ribose 5-phosphate isomerase A